MRNHRQRHTAEKCLTSPVATPGKARDIVARRIRLEILLTLQGVMAIKLYAKEHCHSE
jgi:hypothetical protein